MSSALRRCVGLVPNLAKSCQTKGLLESSRFVPVTSQTASIVSVRKQDPEIFKDLEPFPYKTKAYSKLHLAFPFLDSTYLRINPNSKIITVEGNMTSGTDNVAKKLAEAFGMLYMPEGRIESLYINHMGFDYRTLNKYVAEKLHALDLETFYKNPKHEAAPWLKLLFYKLRYMQYIDALAHLFNTGKGVVLERSVQSDFVFADAMYKHGWIPKDAYDYYYRLRYDTIHKLLRPHLVIYLDMDSELALKNIKAKNVPYLSNTPVLTKEYLQTIEQSYKERYLPDISQFSELMVYNWNKPGSIEDMVLDIENLNMDDWDMEQNKFKDWNLIWNDYWDHNRYMYTTEKARLIAEFNQTLTYDTDSVELDWTDAEHRDNVFHSFVPNYGVQPCWNKERVGLLKSIFSSPFFYPHETTEFHCKGPYM